MAVCTDMHVPRNASLVILEYRCGAWGCSQVWAPQVWANTRALVDRCFFMTLMEGCPVLPRKPYACAGRGQGQGRGMVRGGTRSEEGQGRGVVRGDTKRGGTWKGHGRGGGHEVRMNADALHEGGQG
eukprot:199279-Chlamydomonas_euryale.AAC.10